MVCLGRSNCAPSWEDWVQVERRARQEPRVCALWCQWGGMGPRLPERGYSTPEVFPWEAGEASQAGSDRPCASRQATCPSPAAGTHPQDQLLLLQFKDRESFLSLGLCLPLGQGVGRVSLV